MQQIIDGSNKSLTEFSTEQDGINLAIQALQDDQHGLQQVLIELKDQKETTDQFYGQYLNDHTTLHNANKNSIHGIYNAWTQSEREKNGCKAELQDFRTRQEEMEKTIDNISSVVDALMMDL